MVTNQEKKIKEHKINEKCCKGTYIKPMERWVSYTTQKGSVIFVNPNTLSIPICFSQPREIFETSQLLRASRFLAPCEICISRNSCERVLATYEICESRTSCERVLATCEICSVWCCGLGQRCYLRSFLWFYRLNGAGYLFCRATIVEALRRYDSHRKANNLGCFMPKNYILLKWLDLTSINLIRFNCGFTNIKGSSNQLIAITCFRSNTITVK